MPHRTQKLLTFLQQIQVNDRHLELSRAVRTLYPVNVALTYDGQIILQSVGLSHRLPVILITSG